MKKIVALALILVLLCGMTACSKPEEPSEPTTTSAPTTTTQSLKGINLLTGEKASDSSSSRPIGIMMPNDSKSIGKQIGIDQADFIIETETEGSIPRLLAIFRNMEALPDKVGPIRSARTPFISTARALDLVYVHVGGSLQARAMLKTGILDNFDAIYDSKTFWRDDQLKAAIDYEHSVATSGEAISARITKNNIRTEATQAFPFKFSETAKTGETPANTVQLRTTASHTVTFKYDEATKTYNKNVGKIETCKPHKTIDGKQLSFTNVLVLYATKFAEVTDPGKGNTCNFENGTGTGYLISMGTCREITFNRTDSSIAIMEKDGTTALLNKGKTYMFLVDKTLAGNEIFQ
ncbi:MAG: DUF3048 domain-containing protein [Clostridia bacterium]|nr:DUF3048 domain-containing protein [Clostridia bacterium]